MLQVPVLAIYADITTPKKIQKLANKDTRFGYHGVGAPTCSRKQKVGKPSWNAAQPVLGHRVMLMMIQGLMDCRKVRDFGSVPGMWTH